MKILLCLLATVLTLASTIWSDNLYKVSISSEFDAELVRLAEVEPVYRLGGAYLVLADSRIISDLETSGVKTKFLASDIDLDEIAVDNRFDRENVKKYTVVYEEGNLRLFRVDKALKASSIDGMPLIPIDNSRLEIEYSKPLMFNEKMRLGDISLDSLIDGVSQDTIDAHLHRLEAFNGRLTGTDSNYAARDWIYDQFSSYGLDSVVLDSFTGIQGGGGGSVPAFNVVAYKTGTRFPGRQIVVGGHFDAVPGSPGVDDNGTGTVGTLEIARILKDIETEMTFIFIAFDSEESGLIGSRHYADFAAAHGDTIVYMLNMDMIGHIENTDFAKLFYGSDDIPYAQLWSKLADSLVGITGVLSGSSGGSDHASFSQNGYDVTFVHEFIFSTVYHQPNDNTDSINFDYLTRMIKASLATVYVVNEVPKPVMITSIIDVGDGQSLQINWEPADPAQVDHYILHYTTVPATQPDSVILPVDSSSYIVTLPEEEQQYSFYILAYDADGRSSATYNIAYGTPYSIPASPAGLMAFPYKDSIQLIWSGNNIELDFHHYAVVRDGTILPDSVFDTLYNDSDPTLDTMLHEYFVAAVDTDGNLSDTVDAPRVSMKTALLQADRVLAVNRSGSNAQSMINEVVTGEFLREALTGWNYDYYSDTTFDNPNRAGLLKMIDYGLVVFGAESGRRQDDIGNDPEFGGILEDIANYLSIGGKVIIFGRWGDIDTEYGADSIFFNPNNYQFIYTDYFDIAFRILPLTYLNTDDVTLESDFIGAFSQMTEYPDLVWDEPATFDHSGSFYAGISGIPCPSIPFLVDSNHEIIYTYNSLTDSSFTEDRPIAWRYLGPDHKYVFFEIPLSFMQRPAAVAALRQSVIDMGIVSDADDDFPPALLPSSFSLSQNYPNPFNPNTVIEFYNPESKPVKATLEVFNILGQRTRLLFNGPAAPGMNRIEWDGRDDSGDPVATGIYFYRMKTDTESMTRKMVLLK